MSANKTVMKQQVFKIAEGTTENVY